MVNVVYAVAVSPGTSANTWTLSMPSGNVLLTPQYAAVAKWAVESAGTTDEKTLLPVAAEGVIAGTTAPLIAEGTGIVAFAGTSTEDKQGTVMYAVTPATATEAPVIGSSDWKDAVPTAKDIADGGAEVKVWYYIQGADAPDGEDATLDNTFNNSDICATPLTVTVLSNQFDLTLKAANANTIESGKATVTVGGTAATVTEGKLEGVKMGSEVKMTAKEGYKFRKVEVKKRAEYTLITVDEVAVTYFEGETWSDLAARNSDVTVSITNDGYVFVRYKGTQIGYSIKEGEGGVSFFRAVNGKAPVIDPTLSYYLISNN